jgi:hypothetical protein
MSDFGVNFYITNQIGAPLYFFGYNIPDPTFTSFSPPAQVPDNASQQLVRFSNITDLEGAEGTVYFLAMVNGQCRQYTWFGTCPLIGSNAASGPGITNQPIPTWGHPTDVYITVTEQTPGWTAYNL